ncbi:MAG TPA: IPT/TIG domain-containing protein [Aggregicoccus sp.]|nr:IPT/TIG domain-containing protein [Aggregicoccus sp.]
MSARPMRALLLLGLLALGACGPGVQSRFEPPPGGPGSVGGPGADAGTLPALEPQLARLSVHFQDAQASALVLEIHGTGFRASSRVTFDGVNRPHQLVSGSLVRVTLTAADVGTRPVVRVVNPAAEGGSSDPVAQPLGWPVPAVASLSPLELRVGELPSSLRLTGRDFLPGATVLVGGVSHGASHVSLEQLEVQLAPDDVAAGASLAVVVRNPASRYAESAPVELRVLNPLPELHYLSPSVLSLQGSSLDGTVVPPWNLRRVRLYGKGINRSTWVTWRGGYYNVAAVMPEGWEVLLPQESLDAGGEEWLALVNPYPGGGPSAAVRLRIEDGPLVTRVEPGVVTAGEEGLLLRVEGAGFGAGAAATLLWDGVERSAQEADEGLLQVALTAADLASAREVELRVRRADGRSSAPARLRIVGEAEVPVLEALEPGALPVGSGPARLRVRGQGFGRSSQVRLDAVAQPTTFVSRELLEVELSAAQLASAALLQVSVQTPGPGGGDSLAAPLRVEARSALPHVAALLPRLADAGSPALTLRVEGHGFGPTSRVLWEGAPLATTLVDAGVLLAAVPAGLLAAEGPARVHVETPAPGGGSSLPLTFGVRPATGALLTGCTPGVLIAGGFSTVTLSGTGFTADTRVYLGEELLERVPHAWTSTQLTVKLGPLGVGAGQPLRVSTPEGGLSGPLFVDVLPALAPPSLTALSRSVLSVGELGEGYALRLIPSGVGLTQAVSLRWNGERDYPLQGLPLHAEVLADELTEARTVEVEAVAPELPASLPLPLAFRTERPHPLVHSLRPASAYAGLGGLTLEVRGAGFHSASVVHWNGQALATTWSREGLSAQVPAAQLATPGTVTVTVSTPAPGGGSSLPLRFELLP